jgi:hypothetical protein
MEIDESINIAIQTYTHEILKENIKLVGKKEYNDTQAISMKRGQ